MKGNYLLQALTVKLETGINPTKITDLTPSEVFDPIERAKEEMEAGTFDENDLGIDIDDIDEIVQEFAKEEEETKKGETKEIKENPVEDAIDNNDEIRDNKEGCKKK
jgi:NH3-dependent NAD+ synthetase